MKLSAMICICLLGLTSLVWTEPAEKPTLPDTAWLLPSLEEVNRATGKRWQRKELIVNKKDTKVSMANSGKF
jgi:hypothetical protein